MWFSEAIPTSSFDTAYISLSWLDIQHDSPEEDLSTTAGQNVLNIGKDMHSIQRILDSWWYWWHFDFLSRATIRSHFLMSRYLENDLLNVPRTFFIVNMRTQFLLVWKSHENQIKRLTLNLLFSWFHLLATMSTLHQRLRFFFLVVDKHVIKSILSTFLFQCCEHCQHSSEITAVLWLSLWYI